MIPNLLILAEVQTLVPSSFIELTVVLYLITPINIHPSACIQPRNSCFTEVWTIFENLFIPSPESTPVIGSPSQKSFLFWFIPDMLVPVIDSFNGNFLLAKIFLIPLVMIKSFIVSQNFEIYMFPVNGPLTTCFQSFSLIVRYV